MTSKLTLSATLMIILRFTRRLWVRVALMAGLALLASSSSVLFEAYLPAGLGERLSMDMVTPILTILASGMLAVTTFSLNVMVSAHQAAAAQTTPRVRRILLADGTTQTVLATFIGAFVYALSALVLVRAQLYADGSAVILMAVTVFVVAMVVIAVLRWVDHLSDLGSVDSTLATTEAAARNTLMQARKTPTLTAAPLTDKTVIAQEAQPLCAHRSGYLQIIDLPGLHAAMPTEATRIYLHKRPGDFVLKGTPVGYCTGCPEKNIRKIEDKLVIGDIRTFEQDASYGLTILSEIAARALSPGINDSGTAIDVLARQERLLWEWTKTPKGDEAPKYPRIFLREFDSRTLIECAFAQVARDGADKIEVVLRLAQALAHIAQGPDPDLAQAARKMAGRLTACAQEALAIKADRDALAEALRDIEM
jgi:uncharacterized membrane protein